MTQAADRLKEARQKAGYDTAKAAAEAMGIPVATYIQHENGGRGMPPARASRYAKFFRVAPEWILYGRGPSDPVTVEPELTGIHVLQPIQAGAWLALDETGQEEPETMPAALDRRYPRAKQWLRPVQGDSMNARGILPGDFAHIIDFMGSNAQLITGMVVEVTRSRASGSLREITLKEVEVSDRGIILWPRSTNPRWKDPVRLNDDTDDDLEVEITGILSSTIRRF